MTNTVPTTGRSSEFQCKQMGFSSVSDFAESLPPKAIIIDVGAGVSQLGHDVVGIRSDITWVNLDPFYAKTKSSDGIQFLAEDIVDPSSSLDAWSNKADLVYSYWMLPHLSLDSSVPAEQALANMKNLLKPNGTLTVGPTKRVGIGLFSFIRYKGTVSYAKKDLSKETMDSIIQTTKLWWLPRLIQRISNRHNIHLLSRFVGGKKQ